MQNHFLKTINPYFQDVKSGRKPFEVRLNDRNYQVGDTLTLAEYDPESNTFSGDVVVKVVTYVLQGGVYGIDPKYVVLGIPPIWP